MIDRTCFLTYFPGRKITRKDVAFHCFDGAQLVSFKSQSGLASMLDEVFIDYRGSGVIFACEVQVKVSNPHVCPKSRE